LLIRIDEIIQASINIFVVARDVPAIVEQSDFAADVSGFIGLNNNFCRCNSSSGLGDVVEIGR
jgi:hypothetical protein